MVVRKILSTPSSISLSLSLPWHMLCVVGCAPHADPMPSALPGLRATCATLSQSTPPHLHPPRAHTRTQAQTAALTLHLCLWERNSYCPLLDSYRFSGTMTETDSVFNAFIHDACKSETLSRQVAYWPHSLNYSWFYFLKKVPTGCFGLFFVFFYFQEQA